MKATCQVCDMVNEVKYYLKKENQDIVILSILLNLKCSECGSIIPMSENTTAAKESTVIQRIKDARDNANYIG